MKFVKKHGLLKRLTALAASAVMLVTAAVSDISGIPKVEAADSVNVKVLDCYDGYGQNINTNMCKAGGIKAGSRWRIITQNGELAYCLEPAKSLNTDSNGNINYTSSTISLTDDQKNWMGLIFLYAYTKKPSDLYSYDDYMPQYLATQLLIWEVVVGQRDNNFAYKSNGYDPVKQILSNFNNSAKGAKVKSYYEQYESAIKADGKCISFAKKTENEAKQNSYTCNNDGTYTFTDKNGQLNNFDVKVTNGSVVSKTATQLKVKVNANSTANITMTQNNVNASGERCGMYVYGSGTNNQKIGLAKADPREYYASVKGVEYGGMKIKKNADDNRITGIKFHVSGNGIDKDYITDSNGYINIENLTPGTYEVSETRDSQIYNEIRTKKVIVESGKTASVTFTNTIKTGMITVWKTAEDGIKANFTFGLCSYRADGTIYKEYPDQITTIAGIASWADLPYYASDNNEELIYVVTEKKMDDRYVEQEEYAAYLGQSVNDYGLLRIYIENTLKRSSVLAVKKDAESGNTVPLPGTKFQILDSDGNIIVLTDEDGNEVDTFTTDESGQVLLPEPLVYGAYQLIEIEAPEGYVLDKTPIDFAITEDGETVQVEKQNTVQKGTITISKTGDAFTSAEYSEDGDFYVPVFGESKLIGAEFEIIAAEDIYTPDGELQVEKDTVVDTLVTGKDGKATSKKLYLGTYKVIETKAPEGYVIDTGENFVTLEYADQNIQVTNADTSFSNNYQQVNISLQKELESSEKYNINGSDYIQYVKFGLYAAEQITAADGTYIPKDGLIETVGLILTEDAANSQFNTKLPFGNYYVKEIATDEHYILDDTKYPVEFVYTGQENAVSEIKINSGKTLINNLKYGRVSGLKIDADDSAELSGAVIGIFNADETEFSEENAIEITESAKDGSFGFEEIPVGNYLVKEIEAPTGYILTDETFPVIISEDGDVKKITIENEKIRGSVQVKKYDLTNKSDLLSGAVFEIFADTNGNKKFDEDSDKSYGFLSEVRVGIYQLDGVEYGNYFLKETKAPEGYVADENYYYFEIRENGEIVVVSNDESTDRFYNDVIRGNVHGIKVNADDKTQLQGALMGLFKNDETEFTEKNALKTIESAKDGSFEFNGIKYGKYIVAEIKAPEGYVLTDKVYDISISVNGMTIEITVSNKPIKGNVMIVKYDSGNPPQILKGAVFAVYSDVNGDGKFTDGKDKLIGNMTESSDGIHEYKDLLYGNYLAKEITAPDGYNADPNYYAFSIANDGETVRVGNNEDGNFYNNEIKGRIEGIKVGEENEPLSGAVIGLFAENETEFTEENAFMTYTTDENGGFVFGDIAYGKYIVAEIKPPTGFILTKVPYPVEISEDGQVIGITVTNGLIRGNAEIEKYDSRTDEMLSGAEFTVYADTNGNGEYDESDQKYGVMSEIQTGKYRLEGIAYGSYFLKETKSPDGYYIDDNYYSFKIETEGETVKITNNESSGRFLNEKITTTTSVTTVTTTTTTSAVTETTVPEETTSVTTTVTETTTSTVISTTPSLTIVTVPYITTITTTPSPSPHTGDSKKLSAIAVSLGLLALAGMALTRRRKHADDSDYIYEDNSDE